MKTSKITTIKLSGLILSLSIFSLVNCWTIPAHAAEKKKKASAKEQPAKESPKQTFSPCHAPLMDMGQDGNLIVSASQDFPVLNLLDTSNQKRSQVKLPKKINDVVTIGPDKAVVSYGPWGEIAVVDLKQGSVGKPFKIGESAESMCKTSNSRVLIMDSETNTIYFVDPGSQALIKTFPLQEKPAQMRWLVPDLKIEVADAGGKVIGTFKLPQQDSPQKQTESKK